MNFRQSQQREGLQPARLTQGGEGNFYDPRGQKMKKFEKSVIILLSSEPLAKVDLLG
jgi:hypothetical protein